MMRTWLLNQKNVFKLHSGLGLTVALLNQAGEMEGAGHTKSLL